MLFRSEYEALALQLARNPSQLAALREKMARNRLTAPLFDTKRSTRALEAAFTEMVRRQRNGEPPESFSAMPEQP